MPRRLAPAAWLRLLLSLASVPAALPGGGLSPEEGGCEDELDCQLNGVCDNGQRSSHRVALPWPAVTLHL